MKRLPVTIRQTAIAIGILILFLLVMDFNSRLETLQAREEQVESVRTQATQAANTQIALHTAIAQATSPGEVINWAVDQAGYGSDTIHPVVPMPAPGDPITEALPETSTPEPQANWQVWWQLFFGD